MCNVVLTLSTNQPNIFLYQLLSTFFMIELLKMHQGRWWQASSGTISDECLNTNTHIFLPASLNAHCHCLSLFTTKANPNTNYKNQFPSHDDCIRKTAAMFWRQLNFWMHPAVSRTRARSRLCSHSGRLTEQRSPSWRQVTEGGESSDVPVASQLYHCSQSNTLLQKLSL